MSRKNYVAVKRLCIGRRSPAPSRIAPKFGRHFQVNGFQRYEAPDIAEAKPTQSLDLRGCLILDLDKLTKLPPKFFPPKGR